MKKRYVFLGVLVAAVTAGYYFMPSLETIVQKVVHKYGSEITGTDVNLKGFKLSLTNGEGTISEITVANPKNYSSPYIFQLGEISVKVNIKSLTTDTVIIDKIAISKPIVTYEMLSLTQNNISEIQKNVAKNTASAEKQETAAAEKTDAEKTESSKKVIIRELTVEGGEVVAVANINGKANNLKVALPKIVMKNIGENNKKANIAATISKVVNTILATASKTVVESQLADVKGIAQENLNNVVGSVKDRVKELGIFGK